MCYTTAMSFTPIPNFDEQSYRQHCPVTLMPLIRDKFNPEQSDFIFRGPEIEHQLPDGAGGVHVVSVGRFDVRPAAIIKAAVEHLGMLPADEADRMREDIRYAQDDAVASRTLRKSAQRENAQLREEVLELYAELAAVYAENGIDNPDYTEAPAEEPYPVVSELLASLEEAA